MPFSVLRAYTMLGPILLAACAQGAALDTDRPPLASTESPAVTDAGDRSDAGGRGNPSAPDGASSDTTGGNGTGGGGATSGTTGADATVPSATDHGADAASPTHPTDAGGGSTPKTDAGTVGPIPADPCTEICTSDTSKDGSSCSAAVRIGRKAALSDSFSYTGDTRGDGDKQDLDFIDCEDGSADNFFRIYLYANDDIMMRLSTTEYNLVLKLVGGPSCELPESSACADDGVEGENELMRVLAPSDGWYHVVTDGPYGPTSPTGQGRYTLSVSVINGGGAGQCVCP